MKTILLVGHPNAGKTTLFNLLTHHQRKVSNYSGVSVDVGIGDLKSDPALEKIQIVDLPGIYHLSAQSEDEAITVSVLLGLNQDIPTYDSIGVILDADHLETTLGLGLYLKEHLPKNIFFILNKYDRLKSPVSSVEDSQQHLKAVEKLEKALGNKILTFSGENDTAGKLENFLRQELSRGSLSLIESKHQILVLERARELMPQLDSSAWVKVVNNSAPLIAETESFQRKSRALLSDFLSSKSNIESFQLTEKIDKIILHPIWGSLIFFAIFYLIFHSIYTVSTPIMDGIENLMKEFGDWFGTLLPDNLIRSLIVDGLIAGVGGVIVFLPQIMILFFLLGLLEQSGYIGRAAFLTDRVMGYFGLSGKCFLPYMSGFACAIPAIMATRTIQNHKEKMATLLTIPLVTCSARLPVYVLLIGTFIPKITYFGFFQSQALAFFFLYFLGGFMALLIAKLFRLTVYQGKTSSFVIDLPHYQIPSFKVAGRQSLRQGKNFLKKAGTVIMGLAVLIWFASTFPRISPPETPALSEKEQAAYSLEHSYLGRMGKTIEPVIKPLGMDWKMGVGVLVAFGARELFVSALGTIYALGDVKDDTSSLRERIRQEVHPVTGAPVYNLAVAWSLMIFFVFSLQCTSTLAIVRKETGSWIYPISMFLYMGLLGYGGAFLAYRLLS